MKAIQPRPQRCGQEVVDGNLSEAGVTVPGLSIGEGQLGALDDGVDVLGREEPHCPEVHSLEQRQLLEEHRTLAPRCRLEDLEFVEGYRQGRLGRGSPGCHVRGLQQAAMALPADVHGLGARAPAVD